MYDGFSQPVVAWPNLEVTARVKSDIPELITPVITALTGATSNRTYAGSATAFTLLRLNGFLGSPVPVSATLASPTLPALQAASLENPSTVVVTIANCSDLEQFDNASNVLRCICKAGAVFVPENPKTKIGNQLLKKDPAAGQCKFCPNGAHMTPRPRPLAFPLRTVGQLVLCVWVGRLLRSLTALTASPPSMLSPVYPRLPPQAPSHPLRAPSPALSARRGSCRSGAVTHTHRHSSTHAVRIHCCLYLTLMHPSPSHFAPLLQHPVHALPARRLVRGADVHAARAAGLLVRIPPAPPLRRCCRPPAAAACCYCGAACVVPLSNCRE